MADLGYRGVEIALRNPDLMHPAGLESTLGKNGMELVAIGTGQAYVDEGISLTDLDDQVRQRAISRMKRHIDLASSFGSQVIIGLIRGQISESDLRATQIGFLESSLSELGAYAEKKNVIVTIEALNRYECNTLNTAEEVTALISEISSPSLKLLLDTFHMNIEEGDMFNTIVKSKEWLSHVHVADSNRRFPGMGHINFSEICTALRTIGFKGYVSGEMMPYPNLETALKKYITKMKEVLHG